jgi:hypothetical protein
VLKRGDGDSIVLRFQKITLGFLSLWLLASCSNIPASNSVRDALSADPRLTNSSPSPQSSPTASPTPGQSPNPSEETAQSADAPAKPGDPNFVGPVPSATTSPSPDASVPFSDIDKAPPELRQAVKDVAQLGVLTPQTQAKGNEPALFEPNKNITRRVYARWLVAANNRIYNNRPARQIRLAVESSQPAFRDVSAKDSDFGAIQGLAEAGLIPSPLTGDNTASLFRPDAPLSREDLILWKIPADTRQALPNATIESVRQTWGFQDANRIDSKALRAVYADFQNGDQANIRRAFAYTTLFQPKRPVTRAEAAAVLSYFGFQGDGISAQEALKGGSKP